MRQISFLDNVKYFTINIFFLPLSNLAPTSFPFSVKLSAVTTAAPSRCYSYRNASEGRLRVQTHTHTLLFPRGDFCISNWFQIFIYYC